MINFQAFYQDPRPDYPIIEDYFNPDAACEIDRLPECDEDGFILVEEPPAPKGREPLPANPKIKKSGGGLASNVLKYGGYLTQADQIPVFFNYFAANYADRIPEFALHLATYAAPGKVKIAGRAIETVRYCLLFKEILQKGGARPKSNIEKLKKVISTATGTFSQVQNVMNVLRPIDFTGTIIKIDSVINLPSYVGTGISVVVFLIDRL